ncbi:MAG TPA: 3-deoxy-manno-octulosonate cytidylyltransferase [Chitinispirillaceae bacterium]|nr:3-deoxy-manno-octulosonate cytidylyltransferase [Chitinispirillaceae bacterium]
MNESIICIIPARYGSTRLPGKPLCDINGLPLVMWVYNCAQRSQAFDRVIVATDDKRIEDVVKSNGGEAVLTSSDHPRGTDRVFEALRKTGGSRVVNLQGDEPLIPANVLKNFVSELKKIDDNTLLTIASHATIEERDNPHVVKVVMNRFAEALYFSRSPLPYDVKGNAEFLKHKGIYGFTAEGLARFCGFPQGELEKRESLEQLRALEYGMKIRCLIHDFESIGIDTPEDLRNFKLRAAANNYGKPE